MNQRASALHAIIGLDTTAVRRSRRGENRWLQLSSFGSKKASVSGLAQRKDDRVRVKGERHSATR
jgi:hypothetical protein